MQLDLLGVFGAGVVTYLTPCVLPLVPVYLAALAGGDVRQLSGAGRGQLLFRALWFVAGFISVFTVMGLGASAVGALLSSHRLLLQTLGGVLILLFGLKLIGVIQVPLLDRVVRANDASLTRRVTWVSAFIMGVLFAAGWSPCVGPVLGSVLTYTASAASSPLTGAGYLALYGAGFALPLLVTALFAEAAGKLIRRLGPWLPKIERAIGILLLVVAGTLIFDAGGNLPLTSAAPALAAAAGAEPQEQPASMLELYSEDCAICRQMKPVVSRVTAECENDRLAVELVNVGDRANRHYIDKYRIVGVPTFIFLDPEGNEVARLVGRQSEDALRQALSALRGEQCPGVGPVPSHDLEPAFPAQIPTSNQEETCPSTSTPASPAVRPSRLSGGSAMPSDPSSAPSAASSQSACSPVSQ